MTICMNPKTDEVLAAMLVENTGRHMCDSGDYYGRSWQRNQGKTVASFEAEPECTYEMDLSPHPAHLKPGQVQHASPMVYLSVFHYLRRRLDFEADLQANLEEFAKQEDQADHSWFGVAEDWLKSLNGQYLDWNAKTISKEAGDGLDLISVMGPEGGDRPMTINTYNEECALTQDIQFTMFTLTGDKRSRDGTVYVALFIHGGCDARSGYTAPKIFSINTSEWTSFLDYSRYDIGTWDKDSNLITRWGDYGNCGPDHEGPVPEKWKRLKLEEFPAMLLAEGQEVPEERGILYVSHDKKTGYCPITGRPLEAWPYPE